MKNIAGGLLLALVLIAAGVVCLAESRHARRLAEAHERLATLLIRSKALNMDLQPFIDNGLLEIRQIHPAELSPGA